MIVTNRDSVGVSRYKCLLLIYISARGLQSIKGQLIHQEFQEAGENFSWKQKWILKQVYIKKAGLLHLFHKISLYYLACKEVV